MFNKILTKGKMNFFINAFPWLSMFLEAVYTGYPSKHFITY